MEMLNAGLDFSAQSVIVGGFLYFATAFIFYCNDRATVELHSSRNETMENSLALVRTLDGNSDNAKKTASDNTIVNEQLLSSTAGEDTIRYQTSNPIIFSLDGVKQYRLHKKSVVYVSDVQGEIPTSIRRYRLHKKPCVRVEDLMRLRA